MEPLYRFIDWFIPGAELMERSERALNRNFVATHLIGPILVEPVGLVVALSDPDPWPIAAIILLAIHSLWALPFLLRLTGDLRLCAALSVQLMCMFCLFGAFNYGGVSSPFLSWLIVALMLGFFYLNSMPLLVLALFGANFLVFYAGYLVYGFAERVPLADLETLGWISIGSATLFMSWMAVYYATIMTMGSKLEREVERHCVTSVRLRCAKEAADRADRARSIFLAKMSHELRTPLNAVIGYSEILMETAEEKEDAHERKRDLSRINLAGKHLLALVTDVLDLTRIERNEITLHPERFDFDEFFRSVISTTAHLVAANGNRFVYLTAIGDEPLRPTSPDDGAPGLGQAETDPTKLRQVVINLLSNAAKFTKDGAVTLLVRRERRSAGDWIEIQVRDTGVGIAPEERERLFQLYGQASASTASKFGGTGLGLAISQKLCALMGGGVTLESERGKGSCFTVRVPAAWSDELAAAAPERATQPEAPAPA